MLAAGPFQLGLNLTRTEADGSIPEAEEEPGDLTCVAKLTDRGDRALKQHTATQAGR